MQSFFQKWLPMVHQAAMPFGKNQTKDLAPRLTGFYWNPAHGINIVKKKNKNNQKELVK